MKVFVACAIAILALVSLAHGQVEEYHLQSRRESELISPYRGLLRSRRDERICEPGSTKMIECNHCSCIVDGTTWSCTRKGCETYQLTDSEIADLIPTA